MPDHIHGILVLTDNPVGAGFDGNPVDHTDELSAKPAPTHLSAQTGRHGIPEIIRGFKTFSAHCINQRRKMQGVPLWQRNYYEHIIRNDASLQVIRQYIQNNPLSWQEDQLHPDCPSKW
jgi:putative transposase